jgi:anti-sigma factor RsiW
MSACYTWMNRLQGLIDGELDAAHATELEAHVTRCTACAQAREDAAILRVALRAEGVRVSAPDRLLARLDAALSAKTAPVSPRPRARRLRLDRAFWGYGGASAAVAAVAAAVVLIAAPALQTADVEHQIVASHVRSQLAGHLIDVASSDQHMVKPWFNGKVDFAPPVVDLADQGFPIVGGRLDYIDKRRVAAIVYRRGHHLINLFIWPDRGRARAPEESTPGEGYTLLHWARGGMTYWAVSDVAEPDLRAFCRLLQSRPAA